MTEHEMVEQLADKEHASWARWMDYLFSKCESRDGGAMVIPSALVERWRRQIETPYGALSDCERDADRAEVAHILPIIRQYANNQMAITLSPKCDLCGIHHPANVRHWRMPDGSWTFEFSSDGSGNFTIGSTR